MKAKLIILCVVATMVLAVNGIAKATIVQRTYTFTGADLINNVFDSTARYSTDGSLKVYEGMRQIGPAEGTAVGATFLGTSYVTKFNDTWNDAVNDNRVLSCIWLSGMDGYAGQWGEDYKPYEWVSGTGPSGWVFSTQTDSSPKVGCLTNQTPFWSTTSAGLALTSTDLADQIFTVTIKFDTDNMWWGNPNNYLYGANTAPNSLRGLTMYFGSYFSKDGTDVNRYVGNMFAIPEPATLIFLALGGLLFARKKK